MGHNVRGYWQVFEFFDNPLKALIGRLRERNDDPVDFASAALVDKLFELACDFEAFWVEAVLTGTVVVDTDEMDAETRRFEIVVNAPRNLARTEDGDTLVETAVSRKSC